MHKFFSILTFSVLASLFVAPALAQDKPKPNPEEVFKKLDKDGDGSLSEVEFIGKRDGDKATKAKEQFAKKDVNKDGKLSLEEFKPKNAK